MATIKHNGIELEEVTKPQIFDPPQEMLVIDEADDKAHQDALGRDLDTVGCSLIGQSAAIPEYRFDSDERRC